MDKWRTSKKKDLKKANFFDIYVNFDRKLKENTETYPYNFYGASSQLEKKI